MRQDGAMWAAAPDMAGREQEEGLRLLAESQGLLLLIVLGVMLQYRSLDLERARLLCGEAGTDPREMQTAASLVTLGALFGFQRQAEGLVRQESQAGGSPDVTDVKLGAVSILVSLIRLFRLMALSKAGEEAAPAQELDSLEELTEPVL